MRSGSEARHRGDDAVLRITRAVAVLLLPFLLVAAAILFLFPTRTGELFAWPIDPPMSAFLLASAYVGGIWYFARTVAARRWHRVRHGFPAVAVFALALLAATLAHLEKFSHNLSFAVWLVLYVTTPLIVVVLAVVQGPHDPRTPEPDDLVIPRPARIVLAAMGACALCAGAIMFVVPDVGIAMWAWQLTPLTAQVTGAVLSLTGIVNVALLRDARWSAFRVLFQAQLVSLAAIALSLLIRNDDLLWDRPATWMFLVLILAAVFVYGGFTLWCERASRRIHTFGR